MLKRIIPLFCIILILSCSTRKDSFKNRTYYKTTAWFNTLFNGQQAIDNRLNEAKQSHQDNYFEILKVSPYGEFNLNDEAEDVTYEKNQGIGIFGRLRAGEILNNENSTREGYAKAEEKALKAIANHSMNINGKERNKLIARAYLMLGEARYFQGKTFQALEALEQVKQMGFQKFIPWAEYYSALAQIQGGNDYVAAKILNKLYENNDLKKPIKALVAQQSAELFYKNDNYKNAIEALDKAIKYTKNKKQKARLYFIQGQILTKDKNYALANEKFSQVYKLKPGFEMEARAIVAKALNFQAKDHNAQEYLSSLKKYARIGNYEKYFNEFWYAMGNIEQKIDSLNLAKKDYLQALKLPMSSPEYRAETYAALAGLYLQKSDYVYANAYYDSAVSVIPQSKRKEELSELSKNLNEVMNLHYLVMRNDSILNVASLPKKDQEEFFAHYIETLKKKDAERNKEDEIHAAEFKTQRKIKAFDASFTEKAGNKFYFYSESAKSNGENEFKRLWGNISLRDNWRNSTTSGDALAEKKAALTGQTETKNPRRYEVAFYLEQIPNKDSLSTLKLSRDTAQLKLGVAYADLLNNPKLGTETLEMLLSTPPKKDSVKTEAYFQLYRINVKENPTISQKYKDIILNQYPNTLYAQYIKNPAISLDQDNSEAAKSAYLEAYNLFEQKEYAKVVSLSDQAIQDFAREPLAPKFSLLKALAQYHLGEKDLYLAELNSIISKYKDTEEAKRAQSLLNIGKPKKDKEEPTEDNLDETEEEPEPETSPEKQMPGQGISIFG
ncbi:type IX secretion system periplasmic lipoprotein PorW/SprE [Ornithobacterium rhinotracheale]|uniref:type IX secretion system periplasmic lipoprotein PorW/SprE n=1 Tax=Ornithobacterium rhinotracheale TaxID=28251 RepID=UPI0040352A76